MTFVEYSIRLIISKIFWIGLMMLVAYLISVYDPIGTPPDPPVRDDDSFDDDPGLLL